jgi:hypothetical protein
MKVLSDHFVLEPELEAERAEHERQRRIKVKFETQARQIIPLRQKLEPAVINPLAEALKGAGV